MMSEVKIGLFSGEAIENTAHSLHNWQNIRSLCRCRWAWAFKMCLTLSCWRGSGWPLKVCSLSLVEGRMKKVKKCYNAVITCSSILSSPSWGSRRKCCSGCASAKTTDIKVIQQQKASCVPTGIRWWSCTDFELTPPPTSRLPVVLCCVCVCVCVTW